MKKLGIIALAFFVLMGCSNKKAEFDKEAILQDALVKHATHEKMDVSFEIISESSVGNSASSKKDNVVGISGGLMMNTKPKTLDALELIANANVNLSGLKFSAKVATKDGVAYIDSEDVMQGKAKISELLNADAYAMLNEALNAQKATIDDVKENFGDFLKIVDAKRVDNGYEYSLDATDTEVKNQMEKVLSSKMGSTVKVDNFDFKLMIDEAKNFKFINIEATFKGSESKSNEFKANLTFNNFDDAVKIEFPNFDTFQPIFDTFQPIIDTIGN